MAEDYVIHLGKQYGIKDSGMFSLSAIFAFGLCGSEPPR